MARRTVAQIQPLELKKRLDCGDDLCLVDVREDWEHTLASIPGSIWIPLGELADRVQELAGEEEIVVYCHHGARSHAGAAILQESGFERTHNLIGGIDVWSQIVDPSIPRY